MRAAIICFTHTGAKTAQKIKNVLECDGARVTARCKKRDFSAMEGIEPLHSFLHQWTKEEFARNDALIFVGAAGIAVRSIAPLLRSKVTDPAVVVVDEKGTFVISLVSGHIGGANELCEHLAAKLGAMPVITTATDRNEKFAVDVFARKNHLRISDMKLAKFISAALLDGEQIGFYSDFSVAGEPPKELTPYETAQKDLKVEYGISITVNTDKRPYPQTLRLVPPIVVLGIGCRRGKKPEELERFVTEILRQEKISLHAIEKICSIDVKAHEEGILQLCEKYHLPFETYTADQLKSTKGDFTVSAFASEQVGVDNVCERSAVLGSEGGSLLVKKTARDGMTTALALREWRVCFE